MSQLVTMKTKVTKGISSHLVGGGLAHNIGLRCPKDLKLAVERMAKLLDRSENSIICECVMAIDEMSRAPEKDLNRTPKLVYLLRSAVEYMAQKG
jgi:hypothetical protein